MHINSCDLCGEAYTYVTKAGSFCSRKCHNTYWNAKAKRISLKLKPEQREAVLALQEKFLRENANANR